MQRPGRCRCGKAQHRTDRSEKEERGKCGTKAREAIIVNDSRTLEQRILARLFRKIESDNSIPRGVAHRIRALQESSHLKDPNAVLKAIAEGVRENAENSET